MSAQVFCGRLKLRNLLTFVTTFWDKEAKTLKLPDDDEIVKAIRVTSGGAIVHPGLLA
jgi:NAD(P) transhydrogenase subunit alpha